MNTRIQMSSRDKNIVNLMDNLDVGKTVKVRLADGSEVESVVTGKRIGFWELDSSVNHLDEDTLLLVRHNLPLDKWECTLVEVKS